MESLIDTFHIDIKLLIAQTINFAIVISVLYFFALKPLIQVMKDRTMKIEKSLEDAKKIEEKLSKTDQEYNKAIGKAKKEANIIMEKANAAAEEKKQDLIKKAKDEIGQIINKEKEQMQIEKARTLKEIKKETADLVVVSLEKILQEKMDNKKDSELIKKIVKNTK